VTTPTPSHILITGATGAIGSALADHYASPGRHLHLMGRDTIGLQTIAARARAQGASVRTTAIDMTQTVQWQIWLDALSPADCPDLLIVNAGQNHPVPFIGQDEDPQKSHHMLTLNLLSAMNLVQAIVPLMRAQAHGQIALISSLAAWRGLPCTPSYSASKAGLKAYGESLRASLAPERIHVSVVLPGYVQSSMCDAMPGPKPWLMTAEQAAARIARGLANNQGRITFPFWLARGTELLSILPERIAHWLLQRLGYGRLPGRRSSS
jgi:short-subunit dehydrogenase